MRALPLASLGMEITGEHITMAAYLIGATIWIKTQISNSKDKAQADVKELREKLELELKNSSDTSDNKDEALRKLLEVTQKEIAKAIEDKVGKVEKDLTKRINGIGFSLDKQKETFDKHEKQQIADFVSINAEIKQILDANDDLKKEVHGIKKKLEEMSKEDASYRTEVLSKLDVIAAMKN